MLVMLLVREVKRVVLRVEELDTLPLPLSENLAEVEGKEMRVAAIDEPM